MKKRIVSLLLALALLVLPVLPAFAAEEDIPTPMLPWVTASPPVWA